MLPPHKSGLGKNDLNIDKQVRLGNQITTFITLDVKFSLDSLNTSFGGTKLVNEQMITFSPSNIFALKGCVSDPGWTTPPTVSYQNNYLGGQLQVAYTYDVNANNRMEIWAVPTTSGAPPPTGNGYCHYSITGTWKAVANFTGPTPTPGTLGDAIYITY